MTVEILLKSVSPTNNFQCDGEHCLSSNSKVRIIPIDDSSNAHLCEECHKHEVEYNLENGLEIFPNVPFSIYPLKLS